MHHFFFIIFCRRDDKIELFVVHFRVETTAPVNQGFHLGTHRVEIDGCRHDNNICSHHLVNDLRGIILLRARFMMQATRAASRAVINLFIS